MWSSRVKFMRKFCYPRVVGGSSFSRLLRSYINFVPAVLLLIAREVGAKPR